MYINFVAAQRTKERTHVRRGGMAPLSERVHEFRRVTSIFSYLVPPRRMVGSRDLKGRQVKVPPSGARDCLFSSLCSRSLYFACFPLSPCPFIAAPLRTGRTGRRSFSRARLFFFRGERSGTCGTKVSESRCGARFSPLRLLSCNVLAIGVNTLEFTTLCARGA